MARTNQGVFKEFLNRQRELVSRYDDVMSEYQAGVDRFFFEGLAQSSGELYDDMDVFLGEFRGMLKSTKFEEGTDNEQKYNKMLDDMEQKQGELKSCFNDWVKKIDNGGGLKGSEVRTIDRYKIWER